MDKMTGDEIVKLINNLVGNIVPIGDTAIDNYAKENIELLIYIVRKLHFQIDNVVDLVDSQYKSKKEIGEIAKDYLISLGILE